MPPMGKCWSCGEIAFLAAKALKKKKTGSLHCVMVCDKCAARHIRKETTSTWQMLGPEEYGITWRCWAEKPAKNGMFVSRIGGSHA